MKNNLFDGVINQIFKLRPFQIFILHSKETTKKSNLVLKNITHVVPTINIDIKHKKVLNNTRETINIHNALNSDLYVIFETVRNLTNQKIKNNLNSIAKSNPLQPRPKCLIILFGDS